MRSMNRLLNSLFIYRQQLMGLSMIAVFSAHISYFGAFGSSFLSIVSSFGFTEGFLFLSGFGIYNSIEKNRNGFYYFKKRLVRLYIPFFLISGPFLLWLTWLSHGSVYLFLARLLSISFFFEGNYYSMWYISVTLLLYSISPYLYKIIRVSNISSLLLLLFATISVNLVLWEINDFHSFKYIVQAPAYIIGMIVAKSGIVGNTRILSFTCMAFVIDTISCILIDTFIFPRHNNIALPFHLSLLFASCFLCRKSKTFPVLNDILGFLGKYSLELYLVHMLLFHSIMAIDIMSSRNAIFISILLSLLSCRYVAIFTNAIINYYKLR